MKPVIKIDFVDFWVHFNKKDNFFFRLLSQHYTPLISNNPDFIIYSGYGQDHVHYNCYRIFYNAENLRINWNACDFAFGFDYLDDKRYFRLPNWFLYGDPRALLLPRQLPGTINPAQRRFCNLVVSNGLSKKRIDFFHQLSKYKVCDSGGRFLNNIGGPVEDKQSFIKNYKFTIAFENSSYPGYATEKIFEPFLAGSIPVYWGDPLIKRDFNSAAFVNFADYGTDKALIDRIIEIDNNDDLYLEMLHQPAYADNQLPVCANEEIISAHLNKFINTASGKPVAQTFRKYYYSAYLFSTKLDFYANWVLRYKDVFR